MEQRVKNTSIYFQGNLAKARRQPEYWVRQSDLDGIKPGKSALGLAGSQLHGVRCSGSRRLRLPPRIMKSQRNLVASKHLRGGAFGPPFAARPSAHYICPQNMPAKPCAGGEVPGG